MGSNFKLSVSCSDLQSRVFKIERGGWSMTAPKRLEIQSQVSRRDRRAGTTLILLVRTLGTSGREHTRAASLAPGAWWQPITTHRGRRGPEREEKGSAEWSAVELELELSETQTHLSRDSRRETLQNCCRAATERLSADRSSPPRQVSQQSSPKQASEGDESDESLHRTASECKSSMDRGRTNECKTCITSHHADSPS